MLKKILGKSYTVVALSVCLLMYCNGAANAAGAWNYLRQLPAKDSGVKIGGPGALALDEQKQRYYLVDMQTGQLVSFDRDGKFLAAFNAGGALKTPVSMARSQNGALWVVDRGDNKLLYINPRQQKVQRFTVTYPDGSEAFPAKVVVDYKNRLFLLDQRQGAILQLDDNLKVVRQYRGDDGCQGFVDFKLKRDQLWALDGLSATVTRFSMSGAHVSSVRLSGLEFPVSLEVDAADQLYLLDRHAGEIVVFSPAGDLRMRFLGKGKRQGQLWFGRELVFDWEERLCVVNEGNGRVDILTR